MLRNIVFICFSLLLYSSCNNEETIPEGILPVSKMADVMVDVNLLEAALSQNLNTGVSVDSTNHQLKFEVFEKHKITAEQYQKNLEYYTQHLDSLNAVYDLVLIQLSEKQARVLSR